MVQKLGEETTNKYSVKNKCPYFISLRKLFCMLFYHFGRLRPNRFKYDRWETSQDNFISDLWWHFILNLVNCSFSHSAEQFGSPAIYTSICFSYRPLQNVQKQNVLGPITTKLFIHSSIIIHFWKEESFLNRIQFLNFSLCKNKYASGGTIYKSMSRLFKNTKKGL